MSLFHKCVWKEVERFYSPPTDRKNVRIDEALPGTIERLTLGVTTIHFVCKCGEHKFVEVFGKKV